MILSPSLHLKKLFAVAMLFFSCAGPIDNDNIRLSELESVWQYLNAYSIYQWEDSTRIPPNPFVFAGPAELMAAIHDTLGGQSFTMYDVDFVNSYSAMLLASNTPPPSTITLDSLTDSTVRVDISEFASQRTYDDFARLLPKVAKYPNILIDLRGNLGGDISETDSIVEDFLPPRTKFIRARERIYNDTTRIAKTLEHFWTTTKDPKTELSGKKVVILMDGHSASASEILIVALKEGLNATLAGDTSYGKGIGQIELVRRERPAIKITYLQMSGVAKIGSYHRKGIPPDVLLNLNTDENKILLAAVKILEPSRTSIRPALRKTQVSSIAQPSGYKVVYE